MTVTIDLPPEIQEWLIQKMQRGQFISPADFIGSRLRQDWLEDQIEEALQEPAAPMSSRDWAEARERLEQNIGGGQ